MGIKHIKEFEQYYSMGTARSYKKLSEEIGVSNRTIENWAWKESWGSEVKLRDAAVLRLQRSESVHKSVESNKVYKNIINQAIVQFGEKLKKGEIKIETISDFDRLIKLSMLLDGSISDGLSYEISEKESDIPTHTDETDKPQKYSTKTLDSLDKLMKSIDTLTSKE